MVVSRANQRVCFILYAFLHDYNECDCLKSGDVAASWKFNKIIIQSLRVRCHVAHGTEQRVPTMRAHVNKWYSL